jgi:hypothetical protein
MHRARHSGTPATLWKHVMGYALSTSVSRPFTEALDATRSALAEQGFGILTEIDLSATLKEKLDADIAPQGILSTNDMTPVINHLRRVPGAGQTASTRRTTRRWRSCP